MSLTLLIVLVTDMNVSVMMPLTLLVELVTDMTVSVMMPLTLLVVLVTDEAFVTLATNDSYAIGALVLGNSLKLVGTTRSLVVMVTQDVSESLR